MTNPRFGFDNLLERFSDGVICTNEDPDHPCLNAYDWRPQTYWRGERLPNIVGNADFLLFSAGPAAPADGWTLFGAGASAAKTTPAGLQALPNALEITRAGATSGAYQPFDGGDLPSVVGRKFGITMRAKTSVAGQLRAIIEDGVTFSGSPYHTGGGAFEILSATVVVGPTATRAWAYPQLAVDGVAEIDWVVVTPLAFDQVSAPEYTGVADSSVYVFPSVGQLLRNWTMEEWPDGGASLPARWETIVGSLTSVARSSNAKVGNSAIEATGNGDIFGQEITGDELDQILGKKVWLGIWCESPDTGARLSVVFRLRDGSLTGELGGTPGAGGRISNGLGAYQWLATSIDVPLDVQGIFIAPTHSGVSGDFTAYWDGALVVQQDAEPDPTPHEMTVDYLAFTAHTAATAGRRILLEGSDDNFASFTEVFSVDPANNLSKWVDDPVAVNTWPAWRYRAIDDPAKTPNYQPLEVGVVTFGELFQMPCAPQSPFKILNEKFQSEIPKTRFGAPLGRSIPRTYKAFDLIFQFLERDFVTDELYPKWWKHAGGTSGKPFFLQWNDGGYENETFLVWLPDNSAFDPNLFVAKQIRNFRIQLEGLSI